MRGDPRCARAPPRGRRRRCCWPAARPAGVLALLAHGSAVLAVQRDVEHAVAKLLRVIFGLQLQALRMRALNAAVVVAHRQKAAWLPSSTSRGWGRQRSCGCRDQGQNLGEYDSARATQQTSINIVRFCVRTRISACFNAEPFVIMRNALSFYSRCLTPSFTRPQLGQGLVDAFLAEGVDRQVLRRCGTCRLRRSPGSRTSVSFGDAVPAVGRDAHGDPLAVGAQRPVAHVVDGGVGGRGGRRQATRGNDGRAALAHGGQEGVGVPVGR